jgi:hypothetical protein
MYFYLGGTLTDINHFMNAKLEQRVIMKFLWNEKRDAVEIHYRLSRAFQKDAYMLPSVHEWIRAFKTKHTGVLDKARAGRSRLDHLNSKIVLVFTEKKSHSVRTLVKELGLI